MTEIELRQKVVNIMRSWLGWSEKNGKSKAIIDLYNTQRPLPRGYKVQYTDEWCATTVTAAGIKAGLSDIILGECSCSRMVELYKAAGRWEERDGYRPQIGDIIMYHWQDGSNYASTDCTAPPNHVGIVAEVAGNMLTIIEGNKGEAVATRKVAVNGRYIRGYCLPDYASKATKEDDDNMSYEKFCEYMDKYRAELGKKPVSAWAEEMVAKAKGAGITDGTRPGDFVTREETTTMIMRAVEHIKEG